MDGNKEVPHVGKGKNSKGQQGRKAPNKTRRSNGKENRERRKGTTLTNRYDGWNSVKMRKEERRSRTQSEEAGGGNSISKADEQPEKNIKAQRERKGT